MDKYINERVTLSIVCPVSNCGAAAAARLYDGLKKAGEDSEVSFELVFVDNGCDDATLRSVREIAAEDDCVGCVSLSRKFPVEVAAAAGCAYASGQSVATILPDESADLPLKALAKWRDGAEIVLHSGKSLPLLVDRKVLRAIVQSYGRVRLDARVIAIAGFKRSALSHSRKIAKASTRFSVWDILLGICGAAAVGCGAAMFLRDINTIIAATLVVAGVIAICGGAIRAALTARIADDSVYFVRETFGFNSEGASGGPSTGGDDSKRFKVMT